MEVHTVRFITKFLILLSLYFATSESANVLTINKGLIVHLFEWRWADVAKECEDFLAPYGFAGVQISPPSENIIVNSPPRPWWERYQPISYKLTTRSGTEDELQDMLNRCNKVGVRVFADAVLNHMTGPAKVAVGTGGSKADTETYSYPAVPYTKADFHQPPCSVSNYNDLKNVRNCELLGLRDLDNSKPNVRRKQLEYLNKLIEMGFAGFRVDAAKHMWPADLKYIFDRLEDLNTDHGFPPNTRPLLYLEVIDNGDEATRWQDYSPLGLVTDFRYGNALGDTLLGGKHDLAWLKNFGTSANLLSDNVGVVFIDNHDTQRDSKVTQLNYKSFRPYKMAIAFMLAYPWGTPHILSSYYFDTYDQGPPHDVQYRTLSPAPITDNLCSNKWVCEHRWRQIYNMVRFHNVVAGTDVNNWWDNGKNQIAFCRGNKGFIAFNRESTLLSKKLQTCLPKGKYCDVISGNLVNNKCTGKTVDVGEDGTATVEINPFQLNDPNVENDGALALHVKAKVLDKSDSGDGSEAGNNSEGKKPKPSGEDKNKSPGGKPSSGDYTSNTSASGSGSMCEKLVNMLLGLDKSPSVSSSPAGGGESTCEKFMNLLLGVDKSSSTSSGVSTGNASPAGGSGSTCEKLINMLLGTEKASGISPLLQLGTDDLALLRAVARVRRIEKILDLLAQI